MSAIMCLDSGGYLTNEKEVRLVPLPKETETYMPVGNGDFIDLVKHTVDNMLGLPIAKEKYALAAKSQRMFGTITYETGHSDHGLNIAMRNSYDGVCTIVIASGNDMFICDNLCLTASGAMYVRKHTRFVWRDLKEQVKAAVANAEYTYEQSVKDLEHFKQVPICLERGYEVLGLAQGKKVLTKQQSSVAFEDWRNPQHEEFSERNAYSLYNCATEGLKKGTADRRIKRQIETHTFFSTIMGIPSREVTA